MKFLTRLILPLLLVTGVVLFLLNYERAFPRIWYMLWPLAIVTLLIMTAVFVYLAGLIKPGLFRTDIRPLSWRSYKELSGEFGDSISRKAHKYAAGTMATIFFIFFLAFIVGTIAVQKRYVDRHLLKYGVTTRGVVVKFIPDTRRKSSRNKADIRFVAGSDTVTYRVKPLKKYTAGDSVTITYSSKDPSFCEIEEQQWRLY
jgi:hypothetical protein